MTIFQVDVFLILDN